MPSQRHVARYEIGRLRGMNDALKENHDIGSARQED